METLSSFPVLGEELKQKVNVKPSPYRFYYKDNDGEEYDLVPDETVSTARPLTDERGRWSPDTDGFSVSRNYTVRTASFLYGKNGIACSDAQLALVLIWTSADSRARSAVEIGLIGNIPSPQQFSLNAEFPKPRFRGRVDFQTAIVIKTAGHPSEGEEHLANLAGTVVGVLDSYSLHFDGAGSTFPIMTVSNSGLLWQVQCDIDDVLTDRFEDSVAILLNRAHRDYTYINPADSNYFNPSFLREVLAVAVSTIVDQVREKGRTDWNDVLSGKAEEGSVGQVIYYFATALNLNLDDPKKCSISLREHFEKNLTAL